MDRRAARTIGLGGMWVIASLASALGGCATDRSGEAGNPGGDGPSPAVAPREPDGSVEEGTPHTAALPPAPAPAPSPAYLTAVERQALRLRRLQFLEARGTVEFRWRDEKGNHFEQGDIDLYLILPNKTGFNISKLGERFAWIGSDAEQWWIFLLKEKPTSVLVQTWAESTESIWGEGMSVVSPKALLQLAGFSPLPDASRVTVVEDAAAKTIVVETKSHPDANADANADANVDGAAEPRLRWTLEASSAFPTKVEVLDGAGSVIATGVLENYVSAALEGVPPGDFPWVPRQITIRRADGGGELKISLERQSASGERLQPRYFDFSELRRAFHPDEIYTRVTPQPVHPSSDATGTRP